MKAGETEQQYVDRLAKELDDEFQRVGPDTVCAFVAETVSGTVSLLLILEGLTDVGSHWVVHHQCQDISRP
jgi:adenosylmethionine-8-amino-7-oxononanoate aminotransferase